MDDSSLGVSPGQVRYAAEVLFTGFYFPGELQERDLSVAADYAVHALVVPD